MERDIVGKRPTFRPARPGSNFYRVLLWLSLILAGIWVLMGYNRGAIKSPFDPTPTPTRVPESYLAEAQAYFDTGKLDDPSSPGTINDAIDAYTTALKQDPNNAKAQSELARIQVYSSSMLRNDNERLLRLEQAVASAEKAVALEPDNSTNHAILAFALDWYAGNPLLADDKRDEALVRANNESITANQLDPQNPLALAFYAEVLADQSKWLQARKYALQAVSLGPDMMDTHRVYAYVLETLAEYRDAILQYQEAAKIAPNLTFIYIRIGVNYREAIHNPDQALDYFARAANINTQLGVQNPLPYIEIAKTYTQQGEFFIAARNAEKALEMDPTNASTYGQLGIIYIKARNYEGAMPLLKCAVRGCSATENNTNNKVDAEVQGLQLTNLTVAYYYVEYGTVMAFLSRPIANGNFCPDARQVLNEVSGKYSDDPTLMAIVQDSEGICRKVEGGQQPGSEAPTPTQAVQEKATPTPAVGAVP